MTIDPFKTDDEVVAFARSWMRTMTRFVRKNVRVCLTSPKEGDLKGEIAFFPALMESCAFYDLLAGLYRGSESQMLKTSRPMRAGFSTRNITCQQRWRFCGSGSVTRSPIRHTPTLCSILNVKKSRVHDAAWCGLSSRKIFSHQSSWLR